MKAIMNQEIIDAIVRSVTKWDLIAQSIITEEDYECPLCSLFVVWSGHCRGCPVMSRTWETRCCGTPYDRINLAHRTTLAGMLAGGCSRQYFHNLLDAVEEEIEFLSSLLPEGSDEAKRYLL